MEAPQRKPENREVRYTADRSSPPIPEAGTRIVSDEKTPPCDARKAGRHPLLTAST